MDTQVPALIIRLDRVRTELAECRTDFERVRVRDEAPLPCGKRSAAILRRRDIQTEASILVCDVERAIHKANPGRQGARTDLNLVIPDNDVSSEVKRQIRWAHSKLGDGGLRRVGGPEACRAGTADAFRGQGLGGQENAGQGTRRLHTATRRPV